ncbi:hypothetical protein B7C51_02495 [Paenibacillus larvae subsp. pulvifaciens]|uniref:Transposase n=1 Tax=Paenibacillus larvae subsp. pulvifaciens TaxID=1477 RepID=A0A1V0UNR5_9BACL|nr:hypothetical protein B7C51_02495 [Paenibacillus larvae subsp. pulvifaciens]
MIRHSYVQAQLNFRSILDQVFPLFSTVFGQLFSMTALEVLRKNPTPEHLLNADHDEMKETIHVQCNRSFLWASQRADDIVKAAKNSLIVNSNSCQITALRLIINLLMEYQNHLANLERAIKLKASTIEGFDVLCSIPELVISLQRQSLQRSVIFRRLIMPKNS